MTGGKQWRFAASEHDFIHALIASGQIKSPSDGPFTNSLFIEFTTACERDDQLIEVYLMIGLRELGQ
jgi:hypothetical protein